MEAATQTYDAVQVPCNMGSGRTADPARRAGKQTMAPTPQTHDFPLEPFDDSASSARVSLDLKFLNDTDSTPSDNGCVIDGCASSSSRLHSHDGTVSSRPGQQGSLSSDIERRVLADVIGHVGLRPLDDEVRSEGSLASSHSYHREAYMLAGNEASSSQPHGHLLFNVDEPPATQHRQPPLSPLPHREQPPPSPPPQHGQRPPSPPPAMPRRTPVAAAALPQLPPTDPPTTDLQSIVDSGLDVNFPPGGSFSVYDMKIRQHYVIPTEHVAVTRGALEYCSYYAKYGPQTRYRFQLCHRQRVSRCSDGAACHYIHATDLPPATSVHVSENFATIADVMSEALVRGGTNTHGYATLPPGTDVDVYPPNCSTATPQRIPSHMILHTVGADRVYRWSRANGPREGAATRPRHCAHYQFKRVCNLGSECHFIHSLAPYIQGLSNTPQDPYTPNPSSASYRVIEQAVHYDTATPSSSTYSPQAAVPWGYPQSLPYAVWPTQLYGGYSGYNAS